MVDTFVSVPQRRVGCGACGCVYIGKRETVVCPGCKAELRTVDVKAVKKVPTGEWIFKDTQISNSSIIGEVIADGSGDGGH
jgi:hypothetical protein